MDARINAKLPQLRSTMQAHRVDACYLFGSAAKGNLRPESDYDLLVRFSDSVPLLQYADNYFHLLDALRQLLGREVDLVTERSLNNPVLKAEINATKVLLYGG